MSFYAVAIDEEGFPHFNGLRCTDEDIGFEVIKNIAPTQNGSRFVTHIQDKEAYIEAFDYPYVLQSIELNSDSPFVFKGFLPYGYEVTFDVRSLFVDEWDRFIGLAEPNSVPFVMSRKAQAQFFELIEAFDDDHIVVSGNTIEIAPLYSITPPVESKDYWTDKYHKTQDNPGWELQKAHPALSQIVAQLKLNKSRVLVLGCGSGNDAAFFAQNGHIVTAVDFSEHAINLAKKKYSHLSNIEWICEDVFKLSQKVPNKSYDLILEHTCYCAVDPKKRNDLVKVWLSKLDERGHLLGLFFTMWRTDHPPFGGTEWELKKRLTPYFQLLYWQRLKPPLAETSRLGIELLVYAQKK